MASLTLNYRFPWIQSSFPGSIFDEQNPYSPTFCNGFKLTIRASARPKTPKTSNKNNAELNVVSENPTEQKPSSVVPSRNTVLQACTVTSVSIAAFGIALRQVSHLGSTEGLPILDCTSKASFDFEMWHIGVIAGLVVTISSLRYVLLKKWSDFAESSEAANQQVLTSLEPLDYLVVAFLPGISEEILFRGALLPLFGFDLKSVFFVAAIFGVLHIGGGRKFSFAIWATFVGFLYGYATIASSSLIVPMASHAVNNLIGGVLWRYQETSKKI